jgi:ribosomal protein L32E
MMKLMGRLTEIARTLRMRKRIDVLAHSKELSMKTFEELNSTP